MPSGGAVLVEPVPMQEPRNWGVLGHLSEEQIKSMKAFIESSTFYTLLLVYFLSFTDLFSFIYSIR